MVRFDEEIDEEAIKKLGKNVVKWILIFTGIVFFLALFFGSFYTVSAGERAILLTFGDPDMTPRKEGLHLKIPFVQDVKWMDIKTQKYEADLTAASKDLQDVNTKIAINYHLAAESVPKLYKEIGVDYAISVIQPLEQETNKAVASQFTAEELITKRDSVRQKMKDQLTEKLLPRGIIVEDVSIIDFKFSESFSAAIERKVTAEQDALTAKNKLEQVKFEKEQTIAKAEGEAKAIEIQARAIQVQGGKDYVQLQAIARWNGVLPTFIGGGAVPFINVPLSNEAKTE